MSTPTTQSRPSLWSRLSLWSLCLPFAATALLLTACHRATPPASTPSETLLSDEPARLTATLSTNTIHIGDPITLTLTALHRPGTTIDFPLADLAHGKDVIVRDTTAPETHPADGDLELTTRHCTLTSLVVSNHVIAENAPVLIHLPDGSTATQSMPFAAFEVITSLADGETELRPMDMTPAHWPAPPSHWLLILLSILALLLLAAALLWYFARRVTVVLAKPTPPPPPHTTALAAIAAMRAEDWTGEGKQEPFFVRLSSIVRTYVEARFSIRAPERTTEEFIRDAVKSPDLTPSHRRLLADFLETSDLVKFARHRPGTAELLTALDSAETFVRETIPAPAPSPSSAAPETAPSPSAKGGLP